jgi:hypothetical protein
MKRILLIIALLIPVGLWAQDETADQGSAQETPPQEGIPLGKFLFSPSVEFVYDYRDNIFLTEKNKEWDAIYTIRPKLLLELPKESSYFRLDWVPQYRWLERFDYLTQRRTDFIDAVATVKTSGGTEMHFSDAYTHYGTLEVNLVDPGHELMIYNGNPFNMNDLQFDLKHFFGEENGFSITADTSTVHFIRKFTGGSPLWFDYTNYIYGAAYERYMTPILRLALGVNYTDFRPDDTLRTRRYKGPTYYTRIYGDFSPSVNASVLVGYQDVSYEGSSYKYRSWNTEEEIIWNFPDNSNITLNMNRDLHPSNYGEASSYTNTGAKLTYNLVPREKFFAAAGGWFFKNDYQGVNRRDDDWTLFANVGYHFGRLASLRVNFNHESRRSTDKTMSCSQGCSYTNNILMINLLIGY